MKFKIYECSNCVGKSSGFIKYGKTSYGKQRYQCKSCKITSVFEYRNNAYKRNINKNIIRLTKEGLGIRSTARILKISATTLLKRIFIIANKISHPVIPNEIHATKRFGTNGIERKNLSLRTHLKRLNRKTICFSRNILILSSILKIYFWSEID